MGNLGQELKYDEDKPRLDLVPPDAIIAIGTIMTYGLNKYFEGGWKSVEPYRYRAALMRHMMEYLREPYGVDSESNYPHLWHVITNAAFLCELEGGLGKVKQAKVKYNSKDFVLTDKETDKIAFRCLSCGELNIFKARTSDGKTCEYCNGYITPVGWAKKKEVDK